MEIPDTLLRSVFKDADNIKITQVSETVKKLELEILKRNEKIKSADLKMKTMSDQITDLTAFRNELTSRNTDLESQVFELKLDQALLTVKLEGSEKEKDCIMGNLETCKESLDVHTENNKELGVKVKKQEEEKKNLVEEIEALQLENADLRELLDSAENDVSKLTSDNRRLFIELKQERDEKAKKLLEMETKFEEVKAQKNLIERKCKNFEANKQLIESKNSLLEVKLMRKGDQLRKIIQNVQEIVGSAKEEEIGKKETSKNAGQDSCFSEASGSFENESSRLGSAKKPERKRKQRNLNVEIRKLRRTSSTIQEPANQVESIDISPIDNTY